MTEQKAPKKSWKEMTQKEKIKLLILPLAASVAVIVIIIANLK